MKYNLFRGLGSIIFAHSAVMTYFFYKSIVDEIPNLPLAILSTIGLVISAIFLSAEEG